MGLTHGDDAAFVALNTKVGQVMTVTQDQYARLQAQVGWELANTIVGLKFGYTDKAWRAAIDILSPSPSFQEYSGMSYEQASREAQRLIEKDGWYRNFDRLATLRAIMQRQRLDTEKAEVGRAQYRDAYANQKQGWGV